MFPNSSSSKGSMDELLELKQKVLISLSCAKTYIISKFRWLDHSNNTHKSGGWSQFLEEQQTELPTVSSTSNGLIALIAAGGKKDSEIVTAAKRLIVEKCRIDGGWSKPSIESHCSHTRITCLALRALLDADEPHASKPIMDGIGWLIKAQNADGGWSILPQDGHSDVTSTSYTMRVLSRVLGMHLRSKEAVARGREWLLGIRNPDFSWGQEEGKSGTLAHTSEAVEGLLASGERSEMMSSVREWLITHIDEDDQILERHHTQIPERPHERLVWTHVSREQALMALFKLESNIAAPEIMTSVNKILNKQVNGTYWETKTFPNLAPVWAIREAVTSLRSYLDYLDIHSSEIAILMPVQKLSDEVKWQKERIAQLEARLDGISLRARLRKVLKFVKKPIPMLTIITILTAGVYVLLRERFKFPSYADTFAGVMGIIGVSLTIFQIIHELRKR